MRTSKPLLPGAMKTTTCLFSLLLCACATVPEPDPPRAKEVTTIHVHSLPPGCFVEYNGEFIGATPVSFTVPSSAGTWTGLWSQPHIIRASIPQGRGYDQRTWFFGEKIPKRVVLRVPGAETWYHASSPQPPAPGVALVQ